MTFELPPLPYDKTALEPHMTAQTFDFHHGKHHNAYVTNLNNLLKESPLNGKSLEAVIDEAWKVGNTPIFNNAAQVWNHSFFWNCMKPGGGGDPTGPIAERIKSTFGSFDAFREQFKAAGVGQFGSGWAWLVIENDILKIARTPNAETPMIYGQTALLTVDVWEHAYYLDFQNRRPDFIQTFLDHLVNWDFVNSNLARTC